MLVIKLSVQVCSGSDWLIAAALASHSLGPRLCGEISMEKVLLLPQDEKESDQGTFYFLSLLTPICYIFSIIYQWQACGS